MAVSFPAFLAAGEGAIDHGYQGQDDKACDGDVEVGPGDDGGEAEVGLFARVEEGVEAVADRGENKGAGDDADRSCYREGQERDAKEGWREIRP